MKHVKGKYNYMFAQAKSLQILLNTFPGHVFKFKGFFQFSKNNIIFQFPGYFQDFPAWYVNPIINV